VADKKLEYWYGWTINDSEGHELINLRKTIQGIDQKRISDPDYLCEMIENFPDQTLMNQKVWYQITMLRQRAFKNEDDAGQWGKVCKALCGDGRKRKTSDKLEDLKSIIMHEIEFFRFIKNRTANGEITVQDAINDYCTNGAKSAEVYEKRLKESENYSKTFYAYNKVFGRLKEKLTEKEIFCFFEKAAEHVNKPNALVDVIPDGRRLDFIKQATWGLYGDDLAIDIEDEDNTDL
jgi:hypothetical protein